MERPGMMIYLNVWERLQRRLSYEQLGRLLSAMLDVLGGQPPQPMDDDPALALAFDMVSDLQERDAERYNAIIEKRREAGRKGGRKRQQNAEQRQANAGKGEQNKPTPIPIPTPTPIPTPIPTLSPSPAPEEAEREWLDADILCGAGMDGALHDGSERETAVYPGDAVNGAFRDGDERETAVRAGDAVNGALRDGDERETAVYPGDAVNGVIHDGDERETAVYPGDAVNASIPHGAGVNGAIHDGDERETAGESCGGADEDGADIDAFFEEQRLEAIRQAYAHVRRETDQPERPGESDASQGRGAPSVRDVLEYARCARLNADRAQAERFIAAQTASGWRDSKGAPIRDWRRWFTGWLDRQPAHGGGRAAPTSMQYDQRAYTPEELTRLCSDWADD